MRLDKLYDLQGRIALVTGGGTGIGWMIARGLATNGAKGYITGRRKEVLERAAESFSQQGTIIPYVPRLGLANLRSPNERISDVIYWTALRWTSPKRTAFSQYKLK